MHAAKASEENKILYMLLSRLLDDSDYEEVMKMTYALTYIILFIPGTLALTYFGRYRVIEGAF